MVNVRMLAVVLWQWK